MLRTSQAHHRDDCLVQQSQAHHQDDGQGLDLRDALQSVEMLLALLAGLVRSGVQTPSRIPRFLDKNCRCIQLTVMHAWVMNIIMRWMQSFIYFSHAHSCTCFHTCSQNCAPAMNHEPIWSFVIYGARVKPVCGHEPCHFKAMINAWNFTSMCMVIYEMKHSQSHQTAYEALSISKPFSFDIIWYVRRVCRLTCI